MPRAKVMTRIQLFLLCQLPVTCKCTGQFSKAMTNPHPNSFTAASFLDLKRGAAFPDLFLDIFFRNKQIPPIPSIRDCNGEEDLSVLKRMTRDLGPLSSLAHTESDTCGSHEQHR